MANCLRRLCSFILPFLAASATVHEKTDREIGQHDHLYMEVDSAGSTQKSPSLDKDIKEKGAEHSRLASGASLAEMETRQTLTRLKYLPQYPTGPATCDGSQLACPADGSVDPCSTLKNCSTGGFHDCSGSLKICLPNKETLKCESGDDCLLRCTGKLAEESDGSLKKCKELTEDKCNGYYAADPDYLKNGIGYECVLREDRTCGVETTCGVQNPPESLGEQQCFAPEVYRGASNGTCQTKRIRPGKDCQTKCSAGFTPSTETLKCQDGGVFEPTTFSCIANPCRVKQVENALNSGCKEGPEEGEAVIESGLVCTTQCKEGFYQSDDVLRCHAETLSPATFTCEATCAVPSVSNAAAGGICKEGKDQIMPFTSCTTQCATGYTPSVEKLSCRNGAFTPGSIQCNPDPCDAPTGVEFGRTKGPCQEGWTLTSGSACTTQCRAGYTPSIASLACNAATLAPATFQCVPNPCPIPTVKNRLGNGCRGVAGSSVESGKSCKASCKSGYTPSVKQLDCYAETLTPETFVCEPNPCSIPVDSNQEGSGCLGVPGQKDGTVIEHGETCQSECKEGYHPSVESMSCSLGTLSPAKWSCIEDACPAVEGVANAPKVTCKEGKSINSQKSCTTKCRDGYKPNYASLTCRLGKFFPHTYICEPEGCPLPVVKNRLTSGCSGLPHPAVVTSGQSCSAQCDNGYTPSVASLKCFAGKLTPATFVCNEDPCDAPGGIQNGATESCKEGKEIASGDKCTSQCAAGYVPSTAQLSCSLGKLTPSFYSCNPEPCTLPQFANRKGNGCKSKSGQTVASGETCTAECAAGYTPNELSLKCYAGVLTPATFSCFPDPCPLPSISKAQGNGCSNLGGSMIDSGLKCEAACQTGYTPSVKVLACQASILTPDTFTCNPNGCTLPKVQNQAGNGCQGIKGSSIGSGKTCKTQCAAGFTPDVESLSCFAEELTPSTFTCNPTPCTLPAVANAQGNGCKGKVGTVIASGATCKTACMPGYEASEDKLECSAGSLSPATFACAELKCRAPTGIPHAPHVGCAEGRTIRGGKTCTPRCNSGYSPSAASLACKQGVFEPTSYGCLPGSCSIPQISNAASPKCEQGDTIKHGQKCTPKCKPNYIPSNSGLTCTAGNLEPTTFTCKAPCASPNVANAAQPCKEGNLIEHGKSCSSQCDVGFSATSGSLECNDGQLGGAITCQIDMPESGSNFYNCWSGDPHFTCRGGRRSDPLVPGTHWVLKQACPNSPNFMWVQGVYGPVSPSGAMATAFGGMFLGKNILTIRAAARPNWIVKWNDKNLDKAWKLKSGRRRRRRRGKAKYVYDLYGTQLSVYMNGNKIEAGLGYGVTYKAHRHRWNRQNWKISGLYYTDYYQSNQLWTKLCKDGSYGGESIDLPHPRHLYRPAGDDRMVSTAYDLFQQTRATIETKLNTMTTAASLFAEEEVMEANMSLVKKAQPCTGAALEAAEKSCAVLKKETTEEEKEEIEEDEEAKDNQEATYQACVADACMTASNDFGAAGQDVEEESEMQAALKHKKEFRVVAENGACSEGWLATDPNENILSDEEKTRAQQKKNNCTVACKLCRPERRRYLAGPLVLHNETRDACIDQRLAMPKSQEDKERLWTLQKQHCTADKAWVGARYTGGGWKWDDESAVAIQASGTEGDYLCIDKEEGTLVNCEHSTSEKNDALCEGVWY